MIYRVTLLVGLLTALITPELAPANWSQRLQDQRAAFRDVWPRALDGDAAALRQHETLLADYPLYPDLQAAWLKTQLGRVSDQEIAGFIARNPNSSAVRDLRYHWTRSLGARKQWGKYLDVYRLEYAQADDEILHCLALTARLRTEPDSALAKDALAFWLVGESRADECDPAFDWLSTNNLIRDEDRRQRIELALKDRNFQLAAWLAKPMQESDQEHVRQWRRMRHRPDEALSKSQNLSDSAQNRELLVYGVKRLARRDLDAAAAAWSRIETDFSFDEIQRRTVLRTLAFAAAQNYQPQAYSRIFGLDRNMIDDSLLEWGVRSVLRDRDWHSVLQAIAAMSNSRKSESVWQYWRARALEGTGNSQQAADVYQRLAKTRGYYGFLAADRLDTPYEFNHRPALADEQMLLQLEGHDGLVRARELFFVDLQGKGRSEWDRGVDRLSRTEQAQSAILANRWGWYSRGIATAARAGIGDDLSLSYPIAFRELIEARSAELGLSTTWAFGITRSESLFMPDVASSAGALGLMQLMPATGRVTARQARIRYHGSYALLNPETNIALGTYYLDRMYAEFSDHQVLATAAYNAGPHRVSHWLPADEPMAADIWVDTVPYRETRGYLRRVLSADVIFHWRLTGETRRLAAIMPPVPTEMN